MKRAFILFPLILGGCQTSAAWYYMHPDKQVVVIDDREINVVPRGDNKYDAWGGDEGVDNNMIVLKQRQIKAIEQVSKCKVAQAEYQPSSYLLQSVVVCGRLKKNG